MEQVGIELIDALTRINTATLYVVAILVSAGAVGAAIALALLGGKFLESSARQPEILEKLQIRMFIVAGLIDAVPIIGIGIALLLVFGNPFASQLLQNPVYQKMASSLVAQND